MLSGLKTFNAKSKQNAENSGIISMFTNLTLYSYRICLQDLYPCTNSDSDFDFGFSLVADSEASKSPNRK